MYSFSRLLFLILAMRKPIFKSPLATAAAGALVLFGSVACQGPGQEALSTTSRVYATMLNGMLKKSVPFVSVDQIKKQPPAVLLDTRAPREYAVSHLRGARWVGYEEFSLARVQDLPKNTPIVVYCSVGYSARKWVSSCSVLVTPRCATSTAACSSG